MNLSWIPFVSDLLRIAARAVVDGSRMAGVTHETVALTIAKTVLHILGNGGGAAPPQAAPPVVVVKP